MFYKNMHQNCSIEQKYVKYFWACCKVVTKDEFYKALMCVFTQHAIIDNFISKLNSFAFTEIISYTSQVFSFPQKAMF